MIHFMSASLQFILLLCIFDLLKCKLLCDLKHVFCYHMFCTFLSLTLVLSWKIWLSYIWYERFPRLSFHCKNIHCYQFGDGYVMDKYVIIIFKEYVKNLCYINDNWTCNVYSVRIKLIILYIFLIPTCL